MRLSRSRHDRAAIPDNGHGALDALGHSEQPSAPRGHGVVVPELEGGAFLGGEIGVDLPAD